MNSSSLLANLNEKQQEAVMCTEGPLLVIAGAGSGKTRALTHRVAYLIREKQVNPWNILAVTFTNKAASEMQQRIAKLLGIKIDLQKYRVYEDLPTIGTFHSVCVRILRKDIHLLNFENNFLIYDAADQQILVKKIMQNLGIDEKNTNSKAILNHISGAKSELITCEQYSQRTYNLFSERVAQVYKEYQKELKKFNALDFDDIIMKTVELFQKEKKILEYYQEKFKYISVDEYQDTNHSQYTLVNLLAQKYRNLCVIGDNDQAIYSWRGADIQNILDFEKDYPDAKVIKLEQNYRSTKNILNAAHEIIVKNKNRKEKKLWTENSDGEKLEILRGENEREEGQLIVNQIEKHIMSYEHPIYSDFAILYRTNAQSRVLEEAFMRNGIPYKIVGGIKFYARKEIKDILAYLRLIQNPNDNISFLRIINMPPRKIGAKTLELLQIYAGRNIMSFLSVCENADDIEELPEPKKELLKKFAEKIRKLQEMNKGNPASAVIKYTLDGTGYKDFLLEDGTEEGESRLENVQELISVASKYDGLEPGISLNIFLEEISLITDLDSLNDEENAVIMMTIHSAKGLEFPYVFIAGLEEGIFPHSRSLLEQAELEEERRLMYVAVTRAREKLYLLYTKQRMLYGEYKVNAPSQFLMDIPREILISNYSVDQDGMLLDMKQEYGHKPIPNESAEEIEYGNDIDFSDGDRVMHAAFGQGVVLNVTGGVITVAFKKHGVKKLALNIAPIKKI